MASANENELERTDTITKLRKRRGSVKRNLTNMKKWFTALIDPSKSLLDVKIRIDDLKQIHTDFQEVQFAIDELYIDDEERESYREDNHSLEFGKDYYDLLASMIKVVNSVSTSAQPSTSSTIQPSSSAKEQPSFQPQQLSLKLPDISLPEFNGNIEDWETFKQGFRSLVHNDARLGSIQKFHYLKGALKNSKATDLISSLELSADNYNVAWSLLQERFEDNTSLVFRHLQCLFDMNKVDTKSPVATRALLDNIAKHVRGLKQSEVEIPDVLLIFLISSKIDKETHQQWEYQQAMTKSGKLPNFNNMREFLLARCKGLENHQYFRSNTQVPMVINNPKVFNNQHHAPAYKYARQTRNALIVNSAPPKCGFCCQGHLISFCDEFLKLSIKERQQKVINLRLCNNCLSKHHPTRECRSSYTCKTCNGRHNSLLHIGKLDSQTPSFKPSTSLVTQHQPKLQKHVFLATAIIDVYDNYNVPHPCRVLLDSGSHSNFISERMKQLLGIRMQKSNVEISGFNLNKTTITHSVTTTIKSRTSDYTTELEFLIVPNITSSLPDTSININNWKIPDGITLADPQFNIRGRIDMLIGAEIYIQLIWQGQLRLSESHPLLQNTALGWIISGQLIDEVCKTTTSHCHLSVNDNLDSKLQRFWELEECNYVYDNMTMDERKCEEHYANSTSRDSSGRYVVKIPFKSTTSQLGDSMFMASKRLDHLLRRLDKDPTTKNLYQDFINEYQDLGHMEQVPIDSTLDPAKVQYLPHHCIIRPSSTTTKLRVVFDASAKTTSGFSLNDIQYSGAKVQQDLFPIMIRMRKHRYAIIADVVKMFRQIVMHPAHCDLQRILWKKEGELIAYRLNTVTYGTTSAPFLAARTLQQLAVDEQNNFPLASTVLKRDFYVDDLMTGTETVEEGVKLQKELSLLTERAGMQLSKWCSNHPDILAHLPQSMKQQIVQFNDEDESTIKALGMFWKPSTDKFMFKIEPNAENRPLSKRLVLSELASLFDPLGLLGPTIVKAKIFMQQLWQKKLEWNHPLTTEDSSSWKKYQKELLTINDIRIDRCLSPLYSVHRYELHGFSDASEIAFGACVYLRAISIDNQVSTQLVCSKSRVAPLKQQTIPRLELCGATLLAKLMNITFTALEMNIQESYYWTDSTIVLSWITSSSSRLKTFVGNRVTEIQSTTDPQQWRHVRTDANPADCLSRGLTPLELNKLELWWKGPEYLQHPTNSFPINFDTDAYDSSEQRAIKTVLTTSNTPKSEFTNFIERFESNQRMIRVTAHILRFVKNCRNPSYNKKHNLRSNKSRVIIGSSEERINHLMSTVPCLTTLELNNSEQLIVKSIQKEVFQEEIKQLLNHKQVARSSKLNLLNPFLDKHNIMRVGGRITQSDQSYMQKHPVLIPQIHHFTKTLIIKEHLRHLHAGTQATLAAVRQRYWPINGKMAVKQVTTKCHVCRRVSAPSPTQIMSELPPLRVQQYRAFKNAGVDFCGPFLVKNKKQRNSAATKAYISVFVCFATKALHLEVVSDLTAQAFKAALLRFVSRRGVCANLHSDNGTNFVGTHNERQAVQKFIANHETNQDILDFCSNNNIKWHFIPPRSPHHGGIWEAGVKSVKYHLKRVVKDSVLSFEELTTMSAQVEACLNSRPLTPLSTDPNDLEALTPGHFLVLQPLSTLPDHNLIDLQTNRLTSWQKIQQIVQLFWSRWSTEYLNELQQRKKWTKEQDNIKVNDLVLIKEENLPCTQWLLGRVITVREGKDKKVRVVTIKTKSGIKERAITKLVVLPIDEP